MGFRESFVVAALGCMVLGWTAFVGGGCAGFLGVSRDEPSSLDAPTEFRTYAHDLRHVKKECYHVGRCVGYTLRWPAKTRVVLELRPEGFPAVLIVDNKTYEPDEDGVVRYETVTRRTWTPRILVAGKDSADKGPVTLVVGPPASEELSLPDPPPSAEELEAKRLAAERVQREELEALLAKETDGYKREKTVYRGDLADPGPVEARIRRGRCYKVALVAEDGSDVPFGWPSPYLRFEWKGWSFGRGFAKRTTKTHRGYVSEEICPFKNGKARVEWKAPPSPQRIALGPYRLELWWRSISSRDLKALERGTLKDHHESGCAACRAEAAECLSSGRAGCKREFSQCLKSAGVPPSRCD